METFWEFNPELQNVVWHLAHYREISFCENIDKFLLNLKADILQTIKYAAGENISAAESLYYLLMENRRVNANLFQPHDLVLLLANLINSAHEPGKLALLDKQLLPAAVLLAGQGWKIGLPESLREVARALANLFPAGEWEVTPPQPENGMIILGGDPRIHQDFIKNFTNLVRASDAAFFLTGWDFLGVKSHEYRRRFWLDKLNLSACLQIPRIKRQSATLHPAIICCSGKPVKLVRLARIEKVERGDGSLDQEKAISLFKMKPDASAALEVEKDVLLKEPLCKLTPAFWLTQLKRPRSGDLHSKLSDFAQVIRCQLAREKIAMNSGDVHGQQNNGEFIAREINMSDFLAPAALVLPDSGVPVRLTFKRIDSQYKYLLKKGDLIFSFRGTVESTGKVGLVEFEPANPSITGTAFYILRPLRPEDSVWLFWYLQSREARENILARTSGNTMLNINIDDVRDMPVAVPSEQVKEELCQRHAKIVKDVEHVAAAMRRIKLQMKDIAAELTPLEQ